MKGKPINISNIEDSFKEGFQTVKNGINDMAGSIDSESLKSTGSRIRKGSQSFFELLGDILGLLFKFLGKFIGLFLILITGIMLISFIVSLFSLGTVVFFSPRLDVLYRGSTDQQLAIMAGIFSGLYIGWSSFSIYADVRSIYFKFEI